MKSKPFARRSFLKMAGLAGTGAFSALQAGAAWAKAGAAKVAAPMRPAELADFKGEIVTRAHPGYLGWLWIMTWYRIKLKNQYPIMFARPHQSRRPLRTHGLCQQAERSVGSAQFGPQHLQHLHCARRHHSGHVDV